MQIGAGWYQVRQKLELTLDRLFELPPGDLVEFDSLLTNEDMNYLGYVRNFPHLTCLMCSLDEEDLVKFSKGELTLGNEYPPSNSRMALLPATCYKVYLGMKGQRLDRSRVVGCIAKCYRYEDKPLDAYRAFNFTMKEFVCIGKPEDTKAHIERGIKLIDQLMHTLGIDFTYEDASDPFFDATSSVAKLSQALPTKREVTYDGHAVGSLNYHRNYFGQKFGITIDAQPVHTSCVAFGLERWIEMLKDRHTDPAAAGSLLDAVSLATELQV